MKAPIVIFFSVFQPPTSNAFVNPSSLSTRSSSPWYHLTVTSGTEPRSYQVPAARARRSWDDDWEKPNRPEFIIEDDDDADNDISSRNARRKSPPDFTIEDDNDNNPYNENSNDDERSSFSTNDRRPKIPSTKKRSATKMVGTSWMEKNSKFTDDEDNGMSSNDRAWNSRERSSSSFNNRGQRDYGMRETRSSMDAQSFRENFRGTRVFVQGIPPGTSWQDLKDHFKVAGSVVFSSVSVDPHTGESKGHGIVQFETTSMAQNAINIMRDYPLHGATLFVREDVQESNNPDARLSSPTKRGPTPPTKWKCANEDNAEYMSPEDLAAIRNLIKARDDARRRRKFEVGDRIRDELKYTHGVFIDDRLRMWWTAIDGNKVPQTIQDINGDGRWKLQTWRQVPTTPENDACVNPDLVEGLLKQRDIARREKDFKTADALLEEARNSPDGDLTLRIHDETRTWRVWTEAPPPPRPREKESLPQEESTGIGSQEPTARERAIRECLAIVEEFAPHKVDEITMVLEKFEGQEFQILKRLKSQYLLC